MAPLTFSPAVIADLKARVVAHNESEPAQRVKLRDLKKIYERQLLRSPDRDRALAKVDEHMAKIKRPDTGGEQRNFAQRHPVVTGALSGAALGALGGAGGAHLEGTFREGPAAIAGAGLGALGGALVGRAFRARPKMPETTRQENIYRGVTTDIIPDQSHQIHARIYRGMAAAAIPPLAVTALASRKIGREGAGWVGGHLGRAIGGAAHRIAIQLPIDGVGKAFRLAGRTGVADRLGRYRDFGYQRAVSLGERGGAAALQAPHYLVRGSRHMLHRLADTEPRRKALEAAALGATALAGANYVDRAIQASPLDPEPIAELEDKTGYRRITKAAFAQPLRKEFVAPGVYGAAARAIISGVHAAGGSALGAAIGYGVHRAHQALRGGNPYHDAEGHFTTKAHATLSGRHAALIGAALGGAGAGALAHFQLGRYNRAAFVQAFMEHMKAHEAAIEDTQALRPTHPDLAGVGDPAVQSARVQEIVNSDPELREQVAAMERANVDGVYYREKTREAANTAISQVAAQHNGFRVPAEKGNATLSVGDLRQQGRSVAQIEGVIRTALSGMDEQHVGQAAAALSPEIREHLMAMVRERELALREVDTALADHATKLAEVAGQEATAGEELTNAHARLAAEKDKLSGMEETDPALKTQTALVDSLTDHVKKLTTAQATAQKALRALSAKGVTINDPVNGKRIPPPDQGAAKVEAQKLVQARHATARAQVLNEETRLRNRVAQKLKERHARMLAAAAKLGLHAGALTRRAGPSEELTSALQALNEGNAHIAQTTQKLTAAQRTLAEHEARPAAAQDEAIKNTLRAEIAGHQGRLARLQTSHAELSEAVASRQSERYAAQLLDQTATELAADQKTLLTLQEQAKTHGLTARRLASEAHARLKRMGVPDEGHAHLSQEARRHAEMQTQLQERIGAVQGRVHELQTKLLSRAEAFADVLRVQGGHGFSPQMESTVLRELSRYGSARKQAFLDFLKRPSMKTLVRLTGASWRALGTAKKDVLRGIGHATGSFERNTDGTQEWVPSPRKLMLLGATGTIGATGAAFAHAANYAARRVGLKPPDEKADNRAKSYLKPDWRIDPLTGAGYLTMSVPHARNKGDRTIIWGNTFEDLEKPGVPIVSGANLSDVQDRFRQQTNGARSGPDRLPDMGGLQQQVQARMGDAIKKVRGVNGLTHAPLPGGGSYTYRTSDDPMAAQAGGELRKELMRRAGSAQHTPKDINRLLFQVFSFQGQLLRPEDVYRVLTGYQVNGNKDGKGVFPEDAAFGSTDHEEVATALRKALEPVVAHANNEEKVNLSRAVQAVGIAKSLSPTMITGLQDLVGARAGSFGTMTTPPWETTAAKGTALAVPRAPGTNPEEYGRPWPESQVNAAIHKQPLHTLIKDIYPPDRPGSLRGKAAQDAIAEAMRNFTYAAQELSFQNNKLIPLDRAVEAAYETIDQIALDPSLKNEFRKAVQNDELDKFWVMVGARLGLQR